MSNDYTEFSVQLPLPAETTESTQYRLEAFLQAEERASLELREDDERFDEWCDAYGGYCTELYDENRRPFEKASACPPIWLYSGGDSGNPEAAAAFIQRYLAHFDIEGGVFMTYAQYCSKPRVNEACGGAVVVTKDAQLWVNSYDVLEKAVEEGVEVLNQ